MLWAAGAVLAISFKPKNASAAPTKDQCVDADTQAQNLRRDGKLISAREALRICADESCPRIVREDCTTRLDELTSAVPSVIFAAKDGAGHDLSAVTVTVDGKPMVDHLDGSPLQVDPGEHSFTFAAADVPAVTLKFVIREGERGRHEAILIGPAIQESPPVPLAAERKSDSAIGTRDLQGGADSGGSSASTQRLVAWTALGVGVAGLVVGSAFGLESLAKHGDAQACRATCPDVSSHNANEDALKFGNISTVAFIVGAAGVASGVTLWLTAKPSGASSSAGASVGIGVGSVQFRGAF